jgi:hypothetical protein
MEIKTSNLYKVSYDGWRVYVAAECQQEAIDKVAEDYATEDRLHFNVEWVSVVYV